MACEQLPPKVVLITGASSGLGREFCLQFYRCGFRVLAAARRTHLLQSIVSEARCSGLGDICSITIDVSSHEVDIETAISEAWQRYGRIDVLVNNAGFRGTVRSSLELDEDEWNKAMSTNLRGTWLVSKAVSKRMVEMKIKGSIINISTVASLERGLWPGDSAYAASKAAVIHLTKKMAMELGDHDIRVNGIAPGLFSSEITGDLLNKSWIVDITPKLLPIQRHGTIHPDLTSLVLLLASDSAGYITGNIFVVDGGLTIAGIRLRSSI